MELLFEPRFRDCKNYYFNVCFFYSNKSIRYSYYLLRCLGSNRTKLSWTQYDMKFPFKIVNQSEFIQFSWYSISETIIKTKPFSDVIYS